ncbi:RNA-guided endonuclease InsQ/TnpB family protein [Halosimplex aquaticum]|uniref:RNA-guided endonuclease InsQ/TnpB family protein n=1 Tax=Halosimplex aquaticum TaxID=3026162 RepID=A0ABD5Y2W9_9EURY|nr:transposase [Halosimplex aquaticum]
MAAEYIRRTAITRLVVSRSAHNLLEETLSAWKGGCQIAVNKAWGQYQEQRSIQSIAYGAIRSETELGSQHAILATHQAAEAIQACRTREENGRPISKPTFSAPTVRYDSRSMTLFDDGTVSLSTVDNRVKGELVLPDDEDGYQYKYLSNPGWQLTESTLTIRDGQWFLHLGFRKPAPNFEHSAAENGTVLGVDLGIEYLAVTSSGRFFSGSELQHERERYEKLQRVLQETGTRSAYRTHREVGRRLRRFSIDWIHRVANGILAEARRYDCSTIAFEELTGIVKRLPDQSLFHSWAFRRLISYVEYKATAEGIDVLLVDPRNTSRMCSRTDCDHIDSENRPQRDTFLCQECGYEIHADYNAAKNIGLRAVRCGHKSSHRTGISQCALKSGTIAPGEGFDPYSTGRG